MKVWAWVKWLVLAIALNYAIHALFYFLASRLDAEAFSWVFGIGFFGSPMLTAAVIYQKNKVAALTSLATNFPVNVVWGLIFSCHFFRACV